MLKVAEGQRGETHYRQGSKDTMIIHVCEKDIESS